MTKIVKLTAENVKRLRAVEITPDGNLVVIGGRNAQGKTSVLDCIMYALAGGKALPAKPLRDGEKKGKIIAELDDFIVTRTFTEAGGGTLKVENKEGAQFKSPQAILDGLTGQLAFDPLAFSRMEPRKQLDTLRELVGLDFEEYDAKRKALYDERTAVNRDGKALAAQYDAAPHHEDAPENETPLSELLEEQARLDDAQRAHDEAVRTSDVLVGMEADLIEDIADLEMRLAEKRENLDEVRKKIKRQAQVVNERPDMGGPLAAIRQRIATADEANRKARENKKRAELAALLDEKRAESHRLGEEIKAIDNSKAVKIAAATFPIDGLSIGDDGVLYNGIPLSQASAAEQLRVSVAIGIAANPKLRVMLIRDGSLLDDESLATIASMANDADAQVWIERVGKGAECSVIIEDGAVE
jgi:DNA repair exonuclease SbcCD ATPase subunit